MPLGPVLQTGGFNHSPTLTSPIGDIVWSTTRILPPELHVGSVSCYFYTPVMRFVLVYWSMEDQYMKTCSQCHQPKPLEDYSSNVSRKDGRHDACRQCSGKYTHLRLKKVKLRAIEYLGGKCHHCSGVFHRAAYDFHHKDPMQKDFVWNKLQKRSWKAIQSELDRCLLLCANCHRIEHADKDW